MTKKSKQERFDAEICVALRSIKQGTATDIARKMGQMNQTRLHMRHVMGSKLARHWPLAGKEKLFMPDTQKVHNACDRLQRLGYLKGERREENRNTKTGITPKTYYPTQTGMEVAQNNPKLRALAKKSATIAPQP